MWRILEWNQEVGRGAIGSRDFARLEFDRALTSVDDYEPGEPVMPEFDPLSPNLVLKALRPERPRFPFRSGLPVVLGDALVEQEARAALAKLSGALDLRVRFAPNLVVLELDTRSFEFGPAATLECHAPRYTELASEVQVSHLVLADRGARAYLATKLELSPRDVCLAVIDEHARFGFVVCERLACVASAARQQHRTPGR